MKTEHMFCIATAEASVPSWLIRLAQTTPGELWRDRHVYPYSHVALGIDTKDPIHIEGSVEQIGSVKVTPWDTSFTLPAGTWYFESIWKPKPLDGSQGTAGKNGVRGPIHFNNAKHWATTVKGRAMFCASIPGGRRIIETVLLVLLWAREHVRYAPPAQFWQHATGKWYEGQSTETEWQCSETIARALCAMWEPGWCSAFRLGERTFDQIRPKEVLEAITRRRAAE